MLIEPRKALNKAFLKIKPNRTSIELFKNNLMLLLDSIKEKESEEFHKNLVSDFLKNTYYSPNHFINTKGRNDLVIHTGKEAKTNVGVIIEAKSPTNKAEMLSQKNINSKALQEMVLYFLRERIIHKNLEVKNIVATNVNEWYIFDAQLFDKLFAQNKGLVKQFQDFEEGKLSGTNTDFFYKEIAKPFIDTVLDKLEYTYFDLGNYDKILRNADKTDDTKLIVLYKLLSPEHLLKLSFANDSNSLDKNFYNELLHLIGLTETKEGGKKLIERPKVGQRHAGSLLENVINQLDSLDKLSRLPNVKQYGDTHEERLFTVGLELCITWVNRILFLKLLEAQLISYHKGDKSYAFLHNGLLHDYDNLNALFFMVLAKKPEERNDRVKLPFAKVPYLNSSLFEPTDLEHQTLFISGLEDSIALPYLGSTVIKDANGKKLTGAQNALDYFFDFLDAYDFASEGSEDIQEDNKTLINASVLGLIFEKINGYKDGSFYTPSFITMYMCKETIRRAVVQKFNETKGWHCEDFDNLYNKIEDTKEANAIINSVKICDPAVGSGHFLVSALNEMIAIKHDLKVLVDREGKRLKEYQVEIVNDELIVTDEDGVPFTYNPKSKESQRLQETLFHEKQTLIENCLFGVDINPNSVKICRLRLWIELLKNAYYRNETELETLPNIDINIKCGNSLISRFALDADLKKALKQSKWNIESYKLAVATYRNAESKEQKRTMEELIADIKGNFRSEIASNDPKKLKLEKLKGQLFNQTQQVGMFELSKKEQTEWNKRTNTLAADVKKLETELEEIKSNKIYENAFEWRFEFPEVLNDSGDFVGFDVVIGNPPYGLFNKKQNQKISLETDELSIKYLKENFPQASGGIINAAKIFYALGFSISSESGFQCMIIPYGILTDTTSVNLRKYIFEKNSLLKVDAFPERDNSSRRVFEDVKMSTAIILTTKIDNVNKFDIGISYERSIQKNRSKFTVSDLKELNSELLQIPLTDSKSFALLSKIYKNEDLVKLGKLSSCLTGEIDMTFGKPALTKDNSKPILIKGVQLDRFILKTENHEISQGEIEYINLDVLKTIVSEKKLNDSYTKRIALQGLTGVNERRRIKAVIVNENSFLANSCNYILKPKDYNLELLVALLNSKLYNFLFKTRSTSSNVNGYEIDNLPFLLNNNYENILTQLVNNIMSHKLDNPEADTSALEREIDFMVYELYGLSEEEIAIVENS